MVTTLILTKQGEMRPCTMIRVDAASRGSPAINRWQWHGLPSAVLRGHAGRARLAYAFAGRIAALVTALSLAPFIALKAQHAPSGWDLVYATTSVNGQRLPFATRLQAAPGSSHWVELESLTLRLEAPRRFTVFVRYRHDVLRGNSAGGNTPILDATFHGHFVLNSGGRVTLYPDPSAGGQRRPPWLGTVRGGRVVVSHTVLDGALLRRFTFDLKHDPNIY